MQKPVDKQLYFAAQQGCVIARQRAIVLAALQLQQSAHGITVEMIHAAGIEAAEVGLLAQIIQQQESLLRLGSMDHRRI